MSGVVLTTMAHALAELLHLTPFSACWWPLVVAAAATTVWSEPFEHSHDADGVLLP